MIRGTRTNPYSFRALGPFISLEACLVAGQLQVLHHTTEAQIGKNSCLHNGYISRLLIFLQFSQPDALSPCYD